MTSRFVQLLVAFGLLAGAATAQIFTDGQTILPAVHYTLVSPASDELVVPPSPRLDLPGDEGTIEFWAQPTWAGTGGPAYRCILANGRTVFRKAPQKADAYDTYFEVRYAVYLTRTSVVFQSGNEAFEVSYADFSGGPPFSRGAPTHFALATKKGETTVYVDGRSAVTIPVGYGPTAGSQVTIGNLPRDARGKVLKRKNQKEFSEMEASSDADFGPFTGSLGGVRIWSARLDHAALLTTDTSDNPEPAAIRMYGQQHVERGLSFLAVTPGRDYDVQRADLVAFSQFDHHAGPRMVLADPLGGCWINAMKREPHLGSTPGALKEFEPITVIDASPVIVFVPTPETGDPAGFYSAYVDGELVGALVRREVPGEYELDYLDLAGGKHPVKVTKGGDALEITGPIAELGPDAAGRIDVIRPTARSKGTPAPASDVFLAGMRLADVDVSLKSYDLLKLHPFNFYDKSTKSTGSDQWVFDKGHSDEWQLAFGSNTVLPMGFQLDSHGESQGKMSGTTTTTEREVFNATRAKFGIQGGSPEGFSGGANVEYQQSNQHTTMSTSVSTLGTSWAKWGTVMIDPLFIRLSKDFRDDVYRLQADRNFAAFQSKWGTHYARGVSHGATMYTKRTLDETQVSKLSEWGLDVGAFIQYGKSESPAFKAEASVGTTQRTQARDMLALDKAEWSGNGISQLSTNPEMIVAQIDKDQAVPISMDLRLLHELLSPAYFDEPEIYTTLRSELRDHLLDYLRSGYRPSIEPAVEVPPLYDRLTLRVEVARFHHDANDGDGSEGEFWGTITANAIANQENNLPYDDKGRAQSSMTLWSTDSDNEWGVDADIGWTSFASANGVQKQYEAAKSKYSFMTGPAKLTFDLDVHDLEVEKFALKLSFDVTEEDTGADADEEFDADEIVLRLEDLKDEDQRFVTSEFPHKKLVRLPETGGGDAWVEFEVAAWVEVESHPWKNPSAKAQNALENAIRDSAPTTRARAALELVEAPGVSSEDVLAYFPFDQDGLRKPGARYWTGNDPIPGFVGSGYTAVLDLRPGDEHFVFGLDTDDRYGSWPARRTFWVRHGSSPYSHPGKSAAETLGALDLGIYADGHETVLEDFVKVEPQKWYTLGLAFGATQLTWILYDRENLRVVAKGTHELPACTCQSAVAAFYSDRLRNERADVPAEMDEVYLFDTALSEDQLNAVAAQPRVGASIVALPVAYWPFDTKRKAAPRLQPFQGGLNRIIDDALMLSPSPVTLTPPLWNMRDFTLAFDVCMTDSTRQVLLEDELGQFQIRLFENADRQGLQFKLGERSEAWFLPADISLTPYTGVQLQDYVSTPYVWQRVAITFDGLNVGLYCDDGSGWVLQQEDVINAGIRDRIARVMKERGKKPLAWVLRAEYHHPGTKLEAARGYQPTDNELALVDEVRIWNGAMDAAGIARQMSVPRSFVPPPQALALNGYFPLKRPSGKAVPTGADLLKELTDPVARELHALPVPEISVKQVVDDALMLSAEPVTVPAEGQALSDCTVHFDFLVEGTVLTATSGPLRFRCDGGRTSLEVDLGDDARFSYDPAFGDVLADGVWHKLVVSLDAWESVLEVFLDGESYGGVSLSADVVAALRAADADPRRWRFSAMPMPGGEGGGRALVDELLFLSPALGTFDLELLAVRRREAGGEAPPRAMRRADGLAALDPALTSLRAVDGRIADDVVAYYPLDRDLNEASGRLGEPLAAGAGAPSFADGALDARTDVGGTVAGLDLDLFTIAAWIAPRRPSTTLLSAPGMSVRMGRALNGLRERLEEAQRTGLLPGMDLDAITADPEKAVAMIKSILSSPNENLDVIQRTSLAACVQFLLVFRGVHGLELDLESVDGRKATASLEFALEPRAYSFQSLPDDQYGEGLLKLMNAYRPGTWLSLVLTMDVAAGEVRGFLNGRRLRTVHLPQGFRLRSPSGSAERWVGVRGAPGYPADAMLDEVLVLNGGYLRTSSIIEHLTTRPRRDGLPVDWSVKEGYVREGYGYSVKNAENLPAGFNGAAGQQGVEGQFEVLPGVENRYLLRGQYSYDRHKVLTIVPAPRGPDLQFRDEGEGQAFVFELVPVDEDASVYLIRCRTPGRWNGAYLTIEPLVDNPYRQRVTISESLQIPWRLTGQGPTF